VVLGRALLAEGATQSGGKRMNAQAQLTITLLDTGQIQTSGPIQNEALALWMLDKAKDAIKDHNRRLAEKAIVPASRIVELPNARRNGS
jgi:hypothetical protein